MILTLKLARGEIVKYKDKEGNESYRCKFITSDSEPITCFLDDKQVQPYLKLNLYQDCEVPIKITRAYKNDGKFNLYYGG